MRLVRPGRISGLLVPLVAAGCASFYDEIDLNPDGSGSYHLVLYLKKTVVDEIPQALEQGVRDRAAKIAREAGFTLRSVRLERDGSLLEIDLTADFRDLSVFASPALAVSADQSAWSFVVPREMSYRDGRFRARVLRESAPPPGHPIRASFEGRGGRFTVHLPDRIVQTNGEAQERLANWSLPLARLSDEPVEMIAVTSGGVSPANLLWAGFLVVGVGLLGGSIVRSRISRRRSAEAG